MVLITGAALSGAIGIADVLYIAVVDLDAMEAETPYSGYYGEILNDFAENKLQEKCRDIIKVMVRPAPGIYPV